MTPIAAFIVEDQEDVQKLMRAVLEGFGTGVVVAGMARSGPDALAQIDQVEPDVVILDQVLPGMTGLEVAAEIRRRRPQQILVLCSAFVDRALTRSAQELGFASVLPKSHIHQIPATLLAICAG